MDGILRLVGLILAVVGVAILVLGMLRRAGAVGEGRADTDQLSMLGGAALALVGLGLRVLAD